MSKLPFLLLLGHAPTEVESALLAGVGVRIAATDGVVFVGVTLASDTFVECQALEVEREWGAGRAAWLLTNMPGNQAATPVAIWAAVQKITRLERRIGAKSLINSAK